ncbi:uncharacterized protein EAE97_006000 [Botrytis byssoidea]|uniref:PARP catalytic domain-containing protein n=1 Tax=Botrytis byssoidea TaxID=139641 RepID=A0A9P5M6V8_9HELO|nr:uncharacterized protein EAE97_006000 [Botrytis byssoidea]KAF7943930.1 hypothetical protein EAE97_006000 [Botrytis byssoidea]
MASASSISKAINTMTTTKKTLLHKLAASKVNFYRHSLKPILQAVYALYQIGYLKPGMLLDPVLVNTIAGWYKMSAAELRETVRNEELIRDSEGLTRMDCINLLLQDVTWIWSGKDEENGSDNLSMRRSVLKISAAVKLNSQVIDLLLSSVYADAILRNHDEIHFPGSPQSIPLDDFTEGFPQSFAIMRSTREIAGTLKKAPECLKLVKDLSENYGGYLIPANGKLRISGFPDSVCQFVVVQAPKQSSDASQNPNDEKTGPMVLFHGTSLAYLPSILLNGLEAKSEELYGKVSTLFMAEEPASSYYYVGHRAIDSLWKPDLYSYCGILLACELPQTRNPEWDYETHPDGDVKIGRPQPIHIFGPEDTKFIKVRYVFILPDDVSSDYPLATTLSTMNPLMLKAFKSKIFQKI